MAFPNRKSIRKEYSQGTKTELRAANDCDKNTSVNIENKVQGNPK